MDLHRTNRLVIKDTELEFGGVLGSLLQFLLFFSLPELKVCIYFSHKRLVFNPGGIYLLSKIHCSEIFYLKKNDLSIIQLYLSYTLKIKNLAP